MTRLYYHCENFLLHWSNIRQSKEFIYHEYLQRSKEFLPWILTTLKEKHIQVKHAFFLFVFISLLKQASQVQPWLLCPFVVTTCTICYLIPKDCNNLQVWWKGFNKNRVIRTATKMTETSRWPPMQCNYIPCSLCRITAQSGLGMYVHCVGGHQLVSVLFVAVLITPFLLQLFHYFNWV